MFSPVASLPICRANLIAARLAHSVARKELASFPIGARSGLEQAERAAYAVVETARADFDAAQARKAPVTQARPMTCCHAAVDVPQTHYMRETNCVMHGNRTVGTCD